MHKRRFNEFTLSFVIRPQGPLLIKSGQESGADPTLLDMNFVRTHHAALGDKTVYLPGSSLKGTLRSYAEKVARTLSEGHAPQNPPVFCCNPLGRSSRVGDNDYFCGEKLAKRSETERYALACPICRTFGHTHLAAHLRLSDAYPLNPAQPANIEVFHQTNETSSRDGVAIDRISGAVAVGPFNLEVVTQGAFYGSLTLTNFQLWQLGLLAIVWRDLGQGRVPMGFGKSRGLGRVAVEYVKAELSYPGRFAATTPEHDFAHYLYGVTNFFADKDSRQPYDYRPEAPLPLPAGSQFLPEEADFGRVSLAWTETKTIEGLWRACVPAWRDFVENWEADHA